MEPLILSLETATPICSAALHQGNKLLGTVEYHVGRSHSDRLYDMITSLFKIAQQDISSLSCVAISNGPGSYTGLRVGSAVAKGICYGKKIPLISINTLETLLASSAHHLPTETAKWCALLDARRGYAYALITDEKGNVLQETHTCEVNHKSFEAWGTALPLYFIGNGADHYAEQLHGREKSRVVAGQYAKAQYMGSLAYNKLLAGDIEDLASFSPSYLSAFGPTVR